MQTRQQTTAVAMIQAQLAKIPDILAYLIEDLTEAEWLTRQAPNDNMIGFWAWHIPAVEDFIVQAFIRGVPEVRSRPEWSRRTNLDSNTLSFEISLEEADAAARRSQPEAVIAYAEAVYEEVNNWLTSVSDEILMTIPDGRGHINQLEAYKNNTFASELNGILNRPVHDLLLSTCYGHLRSHFGEIETIKKQLRSSS